MSAESAAAPRQDFGSSERMLAFVESLDLPEFQKDMLRHRWLNQVGWMSRQATKARRRYLWIRVPVVIGGVAIPGLVTILLSAQPGDTIGWLGPITVNSIRFLTFLTSLGVAMLAALEEVLHYGDRWKHYRRTAELLKTLGWQYLMLNGTFRRYRTHGDAFRAFTERVEDVINEDVEGYLGSVAVEARGENRQEIIA